VIRRIVPLVALLVASACSGAGSASSSQPPAGSGQNVPEADQLPAKGTVRFNGRIYTVAAPGTTLALDDVSLRIDTFGWQKNVPVAIEPPGTSTFAIFSVTITNLGDEDATLRPTQIWLLDEGNHPYIPAAGAELNNLLIGKVVPAGKSVTGTLVYAVPKRLRGGLLLYRLADADGIAKAEHVGLLRYR
jgi:uncharacterized protein DUF4352